MFWVTRCPLFRKGKPNFGRKGSSNCLISGCPFEDIANRCRRPLSPPGQLEGLPY